MKGLSNVVAAMLVLIIVITLLTLTVTTLEAENQEYEVTNYINQNYIYIHNLMQTQLNNGLLEITYFAYPIKGGYCIELTFQLSPNLDNSNPYDINITSILELTQSGWSLVSLKYPIEVHIGPSPYTITFTCSQAPDLYITFQYGISIFIPPNTTIT